MSDKTNEEKSRLETYKNKSKWTIPIVTGIVVLTLGAIIGGEYMQNDDSSYPHKQIELQQFEEMNQLDVVVVDQGILSHNEGLRNFVNEYEGTLGLHIYHDEENNERFALISGEEGMEPLTIMLYGIVDSGRNNVVVGYNFVEASPQFQDEVPTMLVRIDGEEEAEVSGRIVLNDDYEHYEDILERYKNNPVNEEVADDNEEEVFVDELADIHNDDGIVEVEEEDVTEGSEENNIIEEAEEEDTNKYGGSPKVINNSRDEAEGE